MENKINHILRNYIRIFNNNIQNLDYISNFFNNYKINIMKNRYNNLIKLFNALISEATHYHDQTSILQFFNTYILNELPSEERAEINRINNFNDFCRTIKYYMIRSPNAKLKNTSSYINKYYLGYEIKEKDNPLDNRIDKAIQDIRGNYPTNDDSQLRIKQVVLGVLGNIINIKNNINLNLNVPREKQQAMKEFIDYLKEQNYKNLNLKNVSFDSSIFQNYEKKPTKLLRSFMNFLDMYDNDLINIIYSYLWENRINSITHIEGTHKVPVPKVFLKIINTHTGQNFMVSSYSSRFSTNPIKGNISKTDVKKIIDYYINSSQNINDNNMILNLSNNIPSNWSNIINILETQLIPFINNNKPTNNPINTNYIVNKIKILGVLREAREELGIDLLDLLQSIIEIRVNNELEFMELIFKNTNTSIKFDDSKGTLYVLLDNVQYNRLQNKYEIINSDNQDFDVNTIYYKKYLKYKNKYLSLLNKNN